MLIASSTFSQEEEKDEKKSSGMEIRTLFSGNDNIEHGGYGALSFNTTTYENKAAFQLGVRAAWLINHKIGIGVDGNVNLNSIQKKFTLNAEQGLVDLRDSTKGPTANLSIYYGGLLLEYIIRPDAPVHVSIPLVLGGGGASFLNKYEVDKVFGKDSLRHDTDRLVYANDEFFYIQPGVELELNVLKFMRMTFGLHYRMIFGLDIIQTEDDAFNGMAGTVSLKFGKF